MSRSSLATNVRLEGALFSRDFLQQLGSPSAQLAHLAPETYGLAPDVKTREAIAAAWNVLAARWARFQSELKALPESASTTGITRQNWLLPLLEELKFGRLAPAAPIVGATSDGEKEFRISHGWNRTPLHLLGAGVDLDKRTPGVIGAAEAAPHALLQECLNRSGPHLWGVVTNGLKWRMLRDSAAIARLSFVEFDLEAIFESEDTASFALFWLLNHASRWEWRTETVAADSSGDEEAEPATESAPPILETWLQTAHVEGTRALDKLRDGVKNAIEILASGFLRHPHNSELRDWLRASQSNSAQFYRLSLRATYRLLFLLVSEAKDALLLPALSGATPDARERAAARELYEKFYSMSALRDRAAKTRGAGHADAWCALRVIFGLLREDGEPGLALPPLGGFLFREEIVDRCELANADLFAALRALCFFEERGARRAVNFNLGAEELGSVYESLLELVPRLEIEARRFALEIAPGNERKTTGSYYTPDGLVKSLLETALAPLLDRAAKAGEAAILDLKICDPACGSGHFLTAAGRTIADRLARARAHGDEPSLAQVRRARREVIGNCLFGVDLNPMAVELCKVALWMEALEPGRPLSFLDSHIKCGNALLGATQKMLDEPLPLVAFDPIEGDDPLVARALKAEHRDYLKGQLGLDFDEGHDGLNLGELHKIARNLERAADSTLELVRAKEEMYRKLESSNAYKFTHLYADAWCSAFVWPMLDPGHADAIAPLTQQRLDKIRRNPRDLMGEIEAEIARLKADYRWFHPHLEFPLVFDRAAPGEAATARDGFDLVLGNPPWERLKLQEKEWFATRAPDVAEAPNAAARGRLIRELQTQQPELHAEFLAARRRAEGESHFARKSGRFPLCGRGDVNTYALFAELNRDLINEVGRVGCIVPSGIATDDTTKLFFADCVQERALVSLFDFENREAIFPGVHRSFKFSLLTLSGEKPDERAMQFVFFAHRADQTDEAERRFTLSPADIALLNPNTRTCPIFRSSRDAELTKAIYRRVPVLINEAEGDAGNPWGIEVGRMFHTSDDSPSFVAEPTETTIRLYESKCYWHFDHRYATFER